jgi:TonB family protein
MPTFTAPLPNGAARVGRTTIARVVATVHYSSRGLKTRSTLWVGIAVSTILHVLVLFGFNERAAPQKAVVDDEWMTLTFEMPDLKELEEPEPQPWEGDEAPLDGGLSVPMLADVPSQVDLSTAFVQEIDYASLVPQQDLQAAATLAIPTNIHRGGKIGEGMGKIFDLQDLDRAPDATVKVAPVVPSVVKEAGLRAEVAVAFIVDASGRVVNPYIVRSTDRRLDDAALMAISKWKFRAGVKGGRKVNVRMMQPFVITVHEES